MVEKNKRWTLRFPAKENPNMEKAFFDRPIYQSSLKNTMSTKLIVQEVRVIFVWPWNENARTKQKQQTNGNKAIWLVYRTDTNAPGFWLVKRTLGWKNFMPEELSRNRFDVILQHDWSIEKCLLHIRIFFGGKTKSPSFVLFNHWLIKQIRNTYRNHFSRTYENRSINSKCGG